MERMAKRYARFCWVWLTMAVLAGATALAAGSLDDARVEEIARCLTEKPQGVGRPISDRAAWEAVGKMDAFGGLIDQAESTAAKPIEDQPDSLFLDFSKTGNRSRWQAVANRRRGRVALFTLAECLENKGRFIEPLEAILRALCAERTWVMPAHDSSLANFHGKSIHIDLGSSMLAWNLATSLNLVGEKLSPEVRDLVRARIDKFIFQPYRDMVDAKRKGDWWMRTTNNWNAVCLAGVTGTALTLIESPGERAYFVAAAEHYSESFLKGFTPDGYCTEGLGYWNYGFGYYVLLSEAVWQATSGKVDLLARPEAKAPARFGARIEIVNRTYPAFADCGVNTRPSGRLMHFLSKRLGLGLNDWEEVGMASSGGYLYEVCIYSFPNSATLAPAPGDNAAQLGLRSWFADAGILVSRPSGQFPFGVALKGGHNAEHHNHNDVGSFVAAVDKYPLIVDPGGETYTARTFSSQRYVSGVLNSLGHSVPRVAGQLQRTGRSAAAKVVRADFTDEADTLVLDISSAYDVPELEALERTFVYSREGRGSLTVRDKVKFRSPEAFGTALVTLNQWHQAEPNKHYFYNAAVCVEADVSSQPEGLVVKDEVIVDGKQPTRVGLDFASPVVEATIEIRIRPIDLPKGLPGIYVAPKVEDFGGDMARAIVVQAEDFTAQSGGEVSVGEKTGAEGKAFKFWDPEGHTLEWRFSVPKAGAYTVQLRQCNAHPNGAERQVFVDGKPIGLAAEKGRFLIPAGTGWSSGADDWQDSWLSQEGDVPRVELEAGEHVLKMVNTDGRGVNMDLIRIVPLKE